MSTTLIYYERVKRHKKKRIDKKWLNRYGCNAVRRTHDGKFVELYKPKESVVQ